MTGYRRRFSASTVSPMSLRMPLSRPFLSVRPLWIGTVTRRRSDVRVNVRWLPRWWDCSKPSRFRIERSSRAVKTGSFSPPMRDGHFNRANQLVTLLGNRLAVFHEAFKMALNRFSGVCSSFFKRFTLTVAPRQGWTEGIVAPCLISFDHNRKPVMLRLGCLAHRRTKFIMIAWSCQRSVMVPSVMVPGTQGTTNFPPHGVAPTTRLWRVRRCPPTLFGGVRWQPERRHERK